LIAADSPIAPSHLPEYLIAQGRYWATTDELLGITQQSPAALRNSLARLIREGRMVSPARGFYVVVPAEHRARRAPPAEWFIDPMMRHLNRPYYVGFLNAAALHCAAHQAPQTFRVVTSRPLADRNVHRVRLRFTTSKAVEVMPTERRTVHTGYIVVATREATVVDLAWQPKLGGGLGNVATVLKEISELDGEALARLAPRHNRATARRLGWLLDRFRPDVDTHWLRVVAEPERGAPSSLMPGGRGGRLDRSWNVRVNASVEPDV
jgi:predicted transcriptional regulator of viral defense system